MESSQPMTLVLGKKGHLKGKQPSKKENIKRIRGRFPMNINHIYLMKKKITS